jgi:hypothetical protein
MVQMVVIVAESWYSGVKFCINDIGQLIYCTIMQNVVSVMQYFVSLMCWKKLGTGFKLCCSIKI